MNPRSPYCVNLPYRLKSAMSSFTYFYFNAESERLHSDKIKPDIPYNFYSTYEPYYTSKAKGITSTVDYIW